jgi:hypothetical protein
MVVFQPKDIYALKIIIERLYWRHDDKIIQGN